MAQALDRLRGQVRGDDDADGAGLLPLFVVLLDIETPFPGRRQNQVALEVPVRPHQYADEFVLDRHTVVHGIGREVFAVADADHAGRILVELVVGEGEGLLRDLVAHAPELLGDKGGGTVVGRGAGAAVAAGADGGQVVVGGAGSGGARRTGLGGRRRDAPGGQALGGGLSGDFVFWFFLSAASSQNHKGNSEDDGFVHLFFSHLSESSISSPGR